MAAGDYASAVARLESRRRAGSRFDFDDDLLLAAANERGEGSYATTAAALDAAASRVGTGPLAPARAAQVATDRALLLSREGRFADAARIILEALALLKRNGNAKGDVWLSARETYGIVLLRMGLAPQAIAVFADVSDERLAALPDGDPRLLTSLFWLGAAELKAGKLPEARDALREVVRVRKLALGADHPDTLQARSLLALVLERSGSADAAKERSDILNIWLRRPDQHDARIVLALLDVADGERDKSGPAAALPRLQMAYRRAIEADPPIERLTAEAAVRCAKALYALGRYGEALDILADASVRTPQIQHTPLAYDLDVTRAVLYRELNRPKDAERIYRQLVEIYDRDETLSRADRLTILNDLAETVAAQSRFSEAAEIQRRVLAARMTMLGATAPPTLSAKSALAAYLSNGSATSLKEGIALHREVLAAREALGPPHERAVAASLHNLGASLDQAGAYAEAKEKLTLAVAIRERLLGKDHPDTINSKRELAGVLFSSGDLTGARNAYVELVASMERARIQSTATDAQRRSYFARFAQAYKVLALLEAHAGSNSAFAYADAAKARTLDELVSSTDAVAALSDPAHVSRLNQARRILGSLASTDTSGMTAQDQIAHKVALDAAAVRVGQIEAELQARHPKLRFASSFTGIDRAKLRSAMGKDTLLLDYIVLGDRVQLLWIAPDGTMGASDLATIPELSDTARAYLMLLSAPALSGTPADPMTDRAVFAGRDGSFRVRRLDENIPDDAVLITDAAPVRDALSQKLLSAVPAKVRNAKRWIVIPDGSLGGIPFDTLISDGHVVAEHTAVSYAPSLRLLVDLHQRLVAYRTISRNRALVMGAPAFGSAPAGSPLRAWSELPGSKVEVEALAKRYHLKRGTSLFTGGLATEERLKQLDGTGALKRYKMLYFSTHGIIDLASPERNAIILLGSPGDPANDGFVRAAELLALHSRADLIVVSACESGVGEWLDGEGAMGLPFALFAAGAAATLLTHWSVADKSSAAFMTRFLTKVDQGADAASALQQTKADFIAGREGEQWKAPAYWAAFSLYGAN